ncbi:lipoyltransferase 1, mitochondrial-like [Odontomachus brunneus]|uniref:lipoyltransferase 1, mitochondrial-like n=1 Tax=Odontomachus brunneus TaxID=486640 RepID=UPI0013F1848D|nr:lipoyltransferase 1, mitochondrial-like [Odontomachus brunneus]XP_032674812.1 lipoyltransferase 1, mitochondrial-like [Odontomachus brunneus]
MALFDRLIIAAKSQVAYSRIQQVFRYMSTIIKDKGDNNVPLQSPIKKSVFVSQSMDIFTNLAWEDWFYRNYDFSNHHVLLLWRNDPCVVYGRHQNPWKECNVQAAEKRGIALARRNSGGGTVYHDNGNLNLSFFTPRERYNRKYNLHIITRALFREWCLKSVVNERDDIVVEGNYKISGSAAKLGRPNAYHHCTLLVDANKNNLRSALECKENNILTNATTSTRSPIKNLIDINSDIEMDKLITVIGREYLRTNAFILEDEGHELSQQQMEYQFIDPTEHLFTGLDKLTSEFRSWDWNFGKTPKFTVNRALEVIKVKSSVSLRAKLGVLDDADEDTLCRMIYLTLHVEVQKGIVEKVTINLPDGLVSTDFEQDANVINNFCGARYNHEILEKIIDAISYKTVTPSTLQSKAA